MLALLLLLIAAPITFQQDGVGFSIERPEGWVMETPEVDHLLAMSDRFGRASLAVNVFDDLLWDTSFAVFRDSSAIFVAEGYRVTQEKPLGKAALQRAAANDGASFHYVREDGKLTEHIYIYVIAKDGLALILTIYLPPYGRDNHDLVEVKNIIEGFRFDKGKTTPERFPPPPDLPTTEN